MQREAPAFTREVILFEMPKGVQGPESLEDNAVLWRHWIYERGVAVTVGRRDGARILQLARNPAENQT